MPIQPYLYVIEFLEDFAVSIYRLARFDLVQREARRMGDTIPHAIVGHHGASLVFIRPAGPGTGVIAGAAVRAVLEAAGVHNVLSKSHRSNNPVNLTRAALDALLHLRRVEDVEALRGVSLAAS